MNDEFKKFRRQVDGLHDQTRRSARAYHRGTLAFAVALNLLLGIALAFVFGWAAAPLYAWLILASWLVIRLWRSQ